MARHQLTVFWILCFAWTSCATSGSVVTSTAQGNVENPPGKHNYSVFLGEVVMTPTDDDTDAVENDGQTAPNTLQAIDDSAANEQQHANNFGLPHSDSVRTLVKRAPSGFMGMRGKKANEFGDWTLDDDDQLTVADDDGEYMPNLYGRRFKKTPSGFFGVRGKKFNYPHGVEYNRYADMWQRAEEQHLRELLVQDFIDRLAAAAAAADKPNDAIEKRAPTGFTGMRGKRLYEAAAEADDFDESGPVKRGPSNAFVGVRGKKESALGADHQNFKRSPGEKSRGKNSRFVDFSNKFVAVRGKKSPNNDEDSEVAAYAYVDRDASDAAYSSEELPKLANLRERYYVNMFPSLVGYGAAGKRTPSGFVGMRGKRSTDAEGLLAELQ